MTTDITELAQREKFEAWFVNDVLGADVNFPAFKDGEYTEGEIYDEQLYFMLQAMWMAWKSCAAELVGELEKAQQRIAELEASHAKLRDAMAAIHNTIRMDGAYTPLAAILNAAKRAHEESASTAGIKVEAE